MMLRAGWVVSLPVCGASLTQLQSAGRSAGLKDLSWSHPLSASWYCCQPGASGLLLVTTRGEEVGDLHPQVQALKG